MLDAELEDAVADGLPNILPKVFANSGLLKKFPIPPPLGGPLVLGVGPVEVDAPVAGE